jgi:hypothetical protein
MNPQYNNKTKKEREREREKDVVNLEPKVIAK